MAKKGKKTGKSGAKKAGRTKSLSPKDAGSVKGGALRRTLNKTY